MVVYDNINMFDMAVECGAAINIENRQHLTPLTMAAFLARMDMFFHIASIEREIYWQVNKGRLALLTSTFLSMITPTPGPTYIANAYLWLT